MIKDFWILDENEVTWRYKIKFNINVSLAINQGYCDTCPLKTICKNNCQYFLFIDEDGNQIGAKGNICAAFGNKYIVDSVISFEKEVAESEKDYKVAMEKNSVISCNEIFQKFCKKICPIKNENFLCKNSLECPFYETDFSKSFKVFVIKD